jgi:hypothetical protein
MFCSNCGKQIEVNAKFCAACGHPVNPSMAVSAEASPATADVTPAPTATQQTRISSLGSWRTPQPLSYLSTACILFFGQCLPGIMLGAFLVARRDNGSFWDALPNSIQYLLFPCIVAVLIASTFSKGETAVVNFNDRLVFVGRLMLAMDSFGYNHSIPGINLFAIQLGETTPGSEPFITYKKSSSWLTGLGWGFIPFGRLAVQVQQGRAVIVGQKIDVRRLLKRVTQLESAGAQLAQQEIN